MPVSGEHKTVQARIIAYAQEMAGAMCLAPKPSPGRGFDKDRLTTEDRARPALLYFGDLHHAQRQEY